MQKVSAMEGTRYEAESQSKEQLEVEVRQKERNALRNFREQSQRLKYLWAELDSVEDLGALEGVHTENGRVVHLILNDKGITGTLEHLRDLKALKVLRLNCYQLTGTLEHLRDLQALCSLNLNNNQLTGTLEHLRDLKALTDLELDNNQLTGTLEHLRDLKALRALELQNNQLTGTLEHLRDLKALKSLHLNNNQLTGTLEHLCDLKALEWLYLHNNQLTGSLTPVFGLTKLYLLKISGGNNFNRVEKGVVPGFLLSAPAGDIAAFVTPGGISPIKVAGMLSIALTMFSAAIAYFDLATDLYTAVQFWKDGHVWWFALAMTFILMSGVITAALSPEPLFHDEGCFLRGLSLLQLRLFWDLYLTLSNRAETAGFVTIKYAEAIFEAVPQLWLQTYVALETSHLNSVSPYLLLSIVTSSVSLAWTITCLLDRAIIEKLKTEHQSERRLQKQLVLALPYLVCTGYHFGEIVVQVCLLGLASYFLRSWSFHILLPYLLATRFSICWIGQESRKCSMPKSFVTVTSKMIGGIYFESIWQAEKSLIAGFGWSVVESVVMIFGTLLGAFVPVNGQSSIPTSNILIVLSVGLVMKVICFVPRLRLHESDESMVQTASLSFPDVPPV